MNQPHEGKARAPKILVIDDEAELREILRRDLSSRGYEVETASGGEQALQKVAATKDFDVAISDLTMPKKNGLETLKELKFIEPSLEIIMVTGYGTIELAVESMRCGAYDFIAKPFENDLLARLVERACEKRRLSLKVEELQEINRFKSEFMANMSHELRTPMNAILGYTSLFLDGVYGEFNAKQQEALKRVESSGRNLLQLINGILDLSKIVAGRMPIYKEDFDLADLIHEAAVMMEGLAKTQGLSFHWNSKRPLRLKTDRTKLKQILVNLIGNAIKFTKKGEVSIDVDSRDGEFLRIRVKDTGMGIKPEDKRLLFQEFRQIDASATREHGGTGLGLALSRKLAELLGGDINVESVWGEGSVFTVSLPLGEVPQTQAEETMAVSSQTEGENKLILAIDDDPEVLTLLRDSLQGTGYGFIGALGGEEGLALARKIKPFAITLDIMMPHRDGWSVLQALKDDTKLRAIPVIILSILDNKSLGFALGVEDYIVKPFDRKELLEKLEKMESHDQPADCSASPRTVLVVENEDPAVRLLVETLKTEGYAVESVGDGERAIQKLENNVPDILFVDLAQRHDSDFDVLKYLQKKPIFSKVRVVILTTKDLTPQEMDYWQSRVGLIVQKDSQELSEILESVKKRLKVLAEVQ